MHFFQELLCGDWSKSWRDRMNQSWGHQGDAHNLGKEVKKETE
jgi:hypothetical protein